MPASPLHTLAEAGQSVWIDSLSRTSLKEGELERLMREDAVTGVTSNPTIFQKAMAEGDAYDEQLREVLESERDPKEIFVALAHRDITDACDLMKQVFDQSSGQDGFVSWEVDPRFAHDTEKTIAEARRLHALVDRSNLYIKIPATPEGLPAITECIASGIPVNVTLIFGLERYRAVAEAYIAGIERNPNPKSTPSVASFFISRVDTEGDKRLEDKPELQGKLAIANAKLAYAAYQEIFSSEAWKAQEARGATPQRCLWASTSTKNPDYRDVLYVEELIGRDTVNTMPGETVEAFQGHGEVRGATVTEGVDDAKAFMQDLEAAGVDYDDIIDTIEREGVEKFEASFAELIEGIESKRDAFVAA